mmetsp:Transcript_19652/g.27796  ORF Transcript_19652/g.27796 Transcript_19652/m.27796 type:complete len:340 (-) Transcript_19652:287-1306(-)
MARINTLVERAMAADPRIKREKAREKQEKLRLAKERKDREEAAKKAALEEKERLEKEKAEQEAKERAEKATLKAQREKEKKQLRKARQLLRKLTLSAFTKATDEKNIWADMEAMNDDVELLCAELSVMQITELTDALGGTDALDHPKTNALTQIKQKVEDTQDAKAQDSIEAKKRREEARRVAAEKAEKAKAAKATAPWAKEELSALAKAIKKYPAGGANRWETIALFVNNMCRPETPRTKEECIEQYNKLATNKPGKPAKGGAPAASSAEKPAAGEPAAPSAAWTDEQDKLLKAALKEFPASIEKNERWTNIAKKIPGKGKKDCVQRFKAIREALKKK